MGNTHSNSTPGSDNPASGSSFASRREARASNMTGALPSLGMTGGERSYSGAFNFEEMLLSLHDLFERDRQIASQPDSTRCGICYLHFALDELHYRDEGFYVCEECERALGHHRMPMLRLQQKL